ncbi:delta(3,5)-Delta(2,4)-dienoyl-CoA isomerase, peroxisomal [Silene latifolia]|uniref:delta(3,5)-Delta(2,4)-dienoyl-CoA isomerase, peroxisomal n=1 Tax=Silene latifolia TaxID=37657 RepID=UPI003D76F6CD
MEEYKSLKVEEMEEKSSVYRVILNRPSQRNALSADFFQEFPKAIRCLDQNPNVSVIILTAAGDHFCSGIDINTLSSIKSESESESSDRGRGGERLRRRILELQEAVTALEQCRKPVIVGIHGACVGGGIDLITACDIRYSTCDAFFSVKEVDLAITADLGTLQRLPSIVGFGNAMDLALTARRFSAAEAKDLGLLSRVFDTKLELDQHLATIAQEMAAKSPLAVMGTKAVLLKTRDMSMEQGLDYVATWNSAMLLSDDLKEALSAFLHKRKPIFAKL